VNAHAAIDFIIRNSGDYAKAKAQRVLLEEWRKSKKALLMKEAMLKFEAVNAQEREAYSHPEYQELLKGLAAAIEIEEELKWKLEAARMRVDCWRTEESTKRMEMKATT
jgi:hypothetical protein